MAYDKNGIHLANIAMLTDKDEQEYPNYVLMKVVETLTRKDPLKEGDKKSLARIEPGLKVVKINQTYEVFNKLLWKKKTDSYHFHIYSDELDDQQEKIRLQSFKRYKNCYEDALIQMLNIDNSTLVTGYISNFYSGKKVLHSWVEREKEGTIVVIDYTKNLVMSKKDYDTLYHSEIISTLSKEEAELILKYVEKHDIDSRFFAIFGKLYLDSLDRTKIPTKTLNKHL